MHINMYPDGSKPLMDTGDWRRQLPEDSQERTVNKIMETLMRHFSSVSAPELKELVVRFEEKTFTAATSQSEYLRTISLKLKTLVSNAQKPMPDPSQPNSASNGQNLPLSQMPQMLPLGNQLNPQMPPSSSLYGLSNSQQNIIQPNQLHSTQECGTIDTNKWKPNQGGELSVDPDDWRSQLPADWRQKIVSKIMDTLRRHLPFAGPERLEELKKIAEKFEKKNYNTATSQSDYLRKISSKMLEMEKKSQNSNPNPNSVQFNVVTNGLNPPDPGTMDTRPTQVGELSVDPDDWRSQLPADARQRIANKIVDTLRRHLPFSGPEGLEEINRVAVRFEEKNYNAATSQCDYLRKISLKMLTLMERRSRNPNPNPNAVRMDFVTNGLNPPDTVISHDQLVEDLQSKLVEWIDNLGRAR